MNPSDPENARIGHDAGFEYPAGSRADYLFNGSLWVGGIVGSDTLVSEGVDGASAGAFEYNSFAPISETYDPIAGRQTFTVSMSDTLVLPTTSDEIVPRLHEPLGLSITQKSHAFKTPPFDAFVIVEYTIRNISQSPISNAYAGLFADADVGMQTVGQIGAGGPTDDLAGFLPDDCIAYVIDNDGDPQNQIGTSTGPVPAAETTWTDRSLRAAFAIAPVGIIPEPSDTAFNWWATNFGAVNWGPSRAAASFEVDGIPFGDANRYATMANGEIDFDQLWSAVDMTAAGWRPGPTSVPLRTDLANGQDTRVLLSFGKFDLVPGDSIKIAFVLASGGTVHVSPSGFADQFVDSNPASYYATLNFSDLKETVRRARQVYELGFQLPSAPPTQFAASLINDSAVYCLWSQAPFEGVTGYRLYRREIGGEFLLIAALDESQSSYVDQDVMLGSTYEYAVSSIDADGLEGTKSAVAVITPGKPIGVPVVLARSIKGRIKVDCVSSYSSAAFSQPKFLNVYRRREGETTRTLIRRFRFEALRVIQNPFGKFTWGIGDAARVRDEEWSKDRFPRMEPPFYDHDLESGVRYHYSATVTNTLGFEGDLSAESSALAMAMDRRGLILFYTHGGPEDFINMDSLRAFYGGWSRARSFDTVTISFTMPFPQNERVTSLEEISHYPVVVLVNEGIIPRFPRSDGSDGLYWWLMDYWRAGGRVVLIARGAVYPDYFGNTPDIIRNTCGVRWAVRERIFELVQPSNRSRLNSQFEGATPSVTGYPFLEGDSAKAWDFSLIRSIAQATDSNLEIGGNIPGVGYVDSLEEGTSMLYTYRSDQPDTALAEGRTVGVRRVTDSAGSAILFAFPLSLIKRDQAYQALSVAVNDLGADTSWTVMLGEIDLTTRILNWLYSPSDSEPDPDWDVNSDGVIDIRDAVESLNR